MVLDLYLRLATILSCTQIPCLNEPALCRIDIILGLDLLDANLDSVLCENHVLLAHALGGDVGHLGDADVDLEAYPAAHAEEGEDDNKRKDLAVWSIRVRCARRSFGGPLEAVFVPDS